MKDRLVAFTLGAAIAVSGCNVLEQAVANNFEFKATLDSNGASADCLTNTNPVVTIKQKRLDVIFAKAFCFDETPDARRIIGMPLSEPFSGEVIVDNIGVIEKPLVATPQP